MVAIGALLHIGQKQQQTPGPGPAQSEASEPSITRSGGLLSLNPPMLICRFTLNGDQPERARIIASYFGELAKRIDGLSAREITFIAPDARDGIGSIRFNDENGQRWLLHTQLIVHTQTRPGAMAELVAAMAQLIGQGDQRAHQKSHAEFLAQWRLVRTAIELPILDAANDVAQIQDMAFD